MIAFSVWKSRTINHTEWEHTLTAYLDNTLNIFAATVAGGFISGISSQRLLRNGPMAGSFEISPSDRFHV